MAKQKMLFREALFICCILCITFLLLNYKQFYNNDFIEQETEKNIIKTQSKKDKLNEAILFIEANQKAAIQTGNTRNYHIPVDF